VSNEIDFQLIGSSKIEQSMDFESSNNRMDQNQINSVFILNSKDSLLKSNKSLAESKRSFEEMKSTKAGFRFIQCEIVKNEDFVIQKTKFQCEIVNKEYFEIKGKMFSPKHSRENSFFFEDSNILNFSQYSALREKSSHRKEESINNINFELKSNIFKTQYERNIEEKISIKEMEIKQRDETIKQKEEFINQIIKKKRRMGKIFEEVNYY